MTSKNAHANATRLLADLATNLVSGDVQVVDLTHRLDPDFPIIVLPPEFGQCAPLSLIHISEPTRLV